MIEPYDVLVFMSGESEQPLIQNWPAIKHKKVVWRTIGQSISAVERSIQPLAREGLKIVRYSPKERNIPNYAGETALIRFYKDPDEFTGWVGNDLRPINFTQTLKGRSLFCHYDMVLGSLVGFEGAKVYGSGNNDLGMFNGGEVTAQHQIELLQAAGCLCIPDHGRKLYAFIYRSHDDGHTDCGGKQKLLMYHSSSSWILQSMRLSGWQSGFVCDTVEQMRFHIKEIIDR